MEVCDSEGYPRGEVAHSWDVKVERCPCRGGVGAQGHILVSPVGKAMSVKVAVKVEARSGEVATGLVKQRTFLMGVKKVVNWRFGAVELGSLTHPLLAGPHC